ncbi:MAG: MFS transporter [Paramuribaculum sp.]|nr:MFS transporter [Paramuribaculum sp.]
MSIKTGKTPLGAGAVAAILSLSLVVNLPGLAVTPMLGTLQSIFPDTTQLEKQLLTLLPNLLIIPCLLISGRLSLLRCKIAIVTGALVVYTLCGVAYLFASSMTELIVISCILGIGAGILIPFSTGLIADTFAGDVRMKEMGYQSAISNLTLVIATYAVGVLSHGNWHLPFVVYLIPIIPLALTPLLRRIPAADLYDSAATPAAKQQQPHGGFIMSRLIAVIGVYFFVTYSVIIISYYCPFLMEKEHWSAALTGAVTAVFFFFTFVPGTAVDQIVRALKGATLPVAAVAILIGLSLFAFVHQQWAMLTGAALMGFGYGVFQPILYNKAPMTVSTPRKATLALAIVLMANYTSIAVAPVFVDACRALFSAAGDIAFAFKLNFFLTLGFVAFVIIRRKSFVFSAS